MGLSVDSSEARGDPRYACLESHLTLFCRPGNAAQYLAAALTTHRLLAGAHHSMPRFFFSSVKQCQLTSSSIQIRVLNITQPKGGGREKREREKKKDFFFKKAACRTALLSAALRKVRGNATNAKFKL